ncbi:BAHD acyltransferase DCR [Impatiens glandulifera]|uniref:BAHD acyltransferase DCR n=1 Tax=Impatiens glandulifera TaxID=253017 RepID=UPI001FB11CC6|nr:BAHD acyltransferase DCR [Impatiens glandulifera]
MAPTSDQVPSMENEKTMVKVKILSKSQVKPAGKFIGRKECQLVTFDLPYIAFFYNQKLLIYKGYEGEFEDVVAKLKDGLGVVLEDFYQLAGKLGRDEEGVFRVEYDDEMDGAEVVVAAADEIAVPELLEVDGASSTRLKDLLPYNGVLNLEGLFRPLLAVQITKLQGGLAIGCAFNHAILDGTSTWHFMRSWAEICCGAPAISVQPFFDRTKVRNTRMKLELPEKPITSNTDVIRSDVPSLSRERIFKFSESTVDRIKNEVNDGRSDGSKPFSTFQSLSAHIWQAVARARQLKPEDPTVFTVFADCRKRVDPAMPDSYFGNLIQAIFTVSSTGLLAESKQFGASMIQKAIYGHDSKVINERNMEFESNPKIFEFKDAGMNCVAVGSSPRFKVYEVDFGFGKPESVRSGLNNRFDGMVYLYPGKSGGRSIDVEISLEKGTMERLEKDKDFLLMEE